MSDLNQQGRQQGYLQNIIQAEQIKILNIITIEIKKKDFYQIKIIKIIIRTKN